VSRSVSLPETRSVPAYDDFETTPELAPLRDAVRSRDWPRAERELASMPADEAPNALHTLAEVAGIEGFLEAAFRAHPGSAFAGTALAMRYTMIGWTARSGAQAADVSQQQFATFTEWLRKAEQLLIEICARHPSFAPAWSARITTARGLELGKSEALRRYRRLTVVSPDEFTAQCQLLQYLLPKWFGSVEEAADFARTTAAAAPAGSNAGALVALFHIERWVELDGRKSADYMGNAEVQQELRDAATRSVLDPAHRFGPLGVQAHSAFAMAHWLGGEYADAAVHLRLLDGRASEFPWHYALDGPGDLARIRDEVLAGSARKGKR
jgi:hypothetical protein